MSARRRVPARGTSPSIRETTSSSRPPLRRPPVFPQVPERLGSVSERAPRRRRGSVPSSLLAGVAAGSVFLLGLAGIVLLLAPLPLWGASLADSQRLPVAGTTAAAVVLAIGAFVAWRQRQEAQAAERFTSALGLLKDPDPLYRAAGARALGAMASEVPAWQPDVVETLCDFIRQRSRIVTEDERDREERFLDIEAAMVELARRQPREDGHARHRLELEGAYLFGFDLRGFKSPRVNLRGACLAGANLAGCSLTLAALSEVELQGANLTGANLGGADLTGANLEGADLTSGHFEDCVLAGAQLAYGVLRGVVLDRATLRGANLRSANLAGASLVDASCSAARMSDTDFRSARLDGADFTSSQMRAARLSDASCRGVDFDGADLTNAILRRALLSGAGFGGANLDRADLGDADVSEAVFSFAIYSSETRLPSGFDPDDRAMSRLLRAGSPGH